LGFLGLFTAQRGYLGFFGFLYYIRYFFVIPDELFRENVQKAATPAFFIGLTACAAAIGARTLLNDPGLTLMGFGIAMALSIFVFTVILIRCEIRESSEGEQ
jgi:hypothetical protein